MTVSPAACILGAAALLVLPLPWLLSAAIAAAFHEFCHYLAVTFCGGAVTAIRINAGGVVMELTPISRGKELLCAMAGPAGSLLLVLFIRWIPLIGFCGVVQGIFNLIPLYPLDGGRAVRCGMELLFPRQAEKIDTLLKYAVLTAMLVLFGYGTLCLQLGILPLLAAVMLTIRGLSRKRPCKDGGLGVQ